MPKVKAKTKPKTKARTKTRANSARKATRGGMRKKAQAGPITRLKETVQRYAIASAAGACVIIVGLFLLLWSGGYVARTADAAGDMVRSFARGAGFEVKRVMLAGGHDTSHAEILEALGPLIGTSLLHVDIDAARGRVENLGWVKHASVSRLLPDTISVSILERAPAALWQMNGSHFLIDDDGAVIRPVNVNEYPHLPMITGAGAPDAAAPLLQALSERPQLAAATNALMRIGRRRWNLRLRNDVDIQLPEDQAVSAVDKLWRLHKAEGILDQPLEYVDLRDPERVIMRRRAASDQEQQL